MRALLLSLLIWVPIGVYSAVRQYSPLHLLLYHDLFVGSAMPVFFFGLIILLFFLLRRFSSRPISLDSTFAFGMTTGGARL